MKSLQMAPLPVLEAKLAGVRKVVVEYGEINLHTV